MKISEKNDAFDILNDISDFFPLVQLMDTLGNVNNATSILSYWIFESNYGKELCLKKIIIGSSMLPFRW